jgi:acyl-CoA dehydrogenase
MDRFEHYGWPFFDEKHLPLAREAETWCIENHTEEKDADSACRKFVKDLGKAGFLKHCVSAMPDVRSIALLREVFAYHHGLADFAFVMQGLGSGPIVLAGSEAQKQAWLPKVAAGEAIAAFALSEPEAGSDVAALQTAAVRHGSGWKLTGTKTWISNGGIADFYVSFAKAPEGISAFIVEAKDVDASERIDIIAPHPMATVKFSNSKAELVGEPGQGFKLAMRNLDVFRTTVAGAALGFARRALA